MKKTVKLTESELSNLIKKILKEEESDTDRYMFFSNLEQIHRQTGKLLEQDHEYIHQVLENGHDWAQDHIATAKESIDQVFDFFMNETKGSHEKCHDCGNETLSTDDSIMKYQTMDMVEDTKKNTPTNKKLWSKAKSIAKSKYKIWPSAYASGFATKWYKSHGGNWVKK
jgi:hypothetical protein